MCLKPVRLALLLMAPACALLAISCSNGSSTVPTSTDSASTAFTMKTIKYGPLTDNVADLRMPTGYGPFPVVILIHGGYWREPYRRDLMDGLADDLTSRRYATWNIEYRRTGTGSSGGSPNTFADVAAAIDHLSVLARDLPLDLGRVAAIGHSAGGHLAAWAAGRVNLPEGTPGADPVVRPLVTVTLAGVLDLKAANALGLGGGAVDELLGAEASANPGLIAATSPIEMLPTDSRLTIVHGRSDFIVPQSQSEAYHAAALARGDSAELLLIDDADHFDVIDPASRAWQSVATRLIAHMPPGR